MENPLLAYGDTEGPIKGFRHPLSDEAKAELEEEEKEEQDGGPSPLAMGLLQLGASMMRDEGWRDRPITLGESLGKAIPRGIAGYYNQDALNRQHEGEANEQRMLEQQAELTRLQGIEDQDEKVKRYKAFVANVESTPDIAFGRTPGSASNRKQNLIQMFLDNPEKAMKALEDIWTKQSEIENRPASPKTYAQIASERASEKLEIRRAGIPEKLAELGMMEDVPESVIQEMQDKYSGVDNLTEEDIKSFNTDFAAARGKRKARDFTNEYQRKYEFLKQKGNWDNLTPQEKMLVESTQSTEDKKEGLDVLNKMMVASEYQTDWKLVETIPTYDLQGNEKTVTKKYINKVTGKEYKEVSRGSLGTVKIESMMGAEIKAKFPKWEKMKFDNNKLYTIETDMGGNVRFSGTIIDLNEKDPDKAKEYADAMRKSAVGMGLITQQDSTSMATWGPDSVIRNLNTLFIQGKEKSPLGDPNSGLIKSGADINIGLDPTGKKKVFKEGKNYYWDGTTWKDVDEDSAKTVFENEQKLRSQYDQNTKKFKDSIFAYNSIVAGYKNSLKDPASAGVNDIMIVRAFLLMIEPNSVVRESEFATAAKSQGLQQYAINLIDKMKEGAILTQVSRRRFFNAAMAYMTAVKSGYDIQNKRYRKIAQAHDIEAENILVDVFADRPELQAEGPYAYKPFKMTDKDWEDLKNTHLEAPGGRDGNQKKSSQTGRRKPVFVRD